MKIYLDASKISTAAQAKEFLANELYATKCLRRAKVLHWLSLLRLAHAEKGDRRILKMMRRVQNLHDLPILPVDMQWIAGILSVVAVLFFFVAPAVDFLLRKHRDRKFARARGVIFILTGLEQCGLSAREILEVVKGLTKDNDCEVRLIRAKRR